uniref:1-alkyl-2-acetylglycerophosphocholine esterase n=1 Tax=Ciona savignyi TaxID=51511 RepID=H2YVJ4_CIOSA
MSTWPRIILFGDSLTQFGYDGLGWVSAVSNLVIRKCDVINRGFSGYNTDFAVKILDKTLDKSLLQNVAAITIFFGANDGSLLELNKHQHVPLLDYQSNLKLIIDHCLSHGIPKEKLIIISPPPVEETMWLQHMKFLGNTADSSDRRLAVVEKYAQVCKKVANEIGCRHVDMWAELINKDLKTHLSDGLHFSDAGSKVLTAALSPIIVELTEHLPIQLPLWDKFDL